MPVLIGTDGSSIQLGEAGLVLGPFGEDQPARAKLRLLSGRWRLVPISGEVRRNGATVTETEALELADRLELGDRSFLFEPDPGSEHWVTDGPAPFGPPGCLYLGHGYRSGRPVWVWKVERGAGLAPADCSFPLVQAEEGRDGAVLVTERWPIEPPGQTALPVGLAIMVLRMLLARHCPHGSKALGIAPDRIFWDRAAQTLRLLPAPTRPWTGCSSGFDHHIGRRGPDSFKQDAPALAYLLLRQVLGTAEAEPSDEGQPEPLRQLIRAWTGAARSADGCSRPRTALEAHDQLEAVQRALQSTGELVFSQPIGRKQAEFEAQKPPPPKTPVPVSTTEALELLSRRTEDRREAKERAREVTETEVVMEEEHDEVPLDLDRDLDARVADGGTWRSAPAATMAAPEPEPAPAAALPETWRDGTGRFSAVVAELKAEEAPPPCDGEPHEGEAPADLFCSEAEEICDDRPSSGATPPGYDASFMPLPPPRLDDQLRAEPMGGEWSKVAFEASVAPPMTAPPMPVMRAPLGMPAAFPSVPPAPPRPAFAPQQPAPRMAAPGAGRGPSKDAAKTKKEAPAPAKSPTLAGGAIEVEVFDEMKREATVRYFTQMGPGQNFPLIAIISKHKIRMLVQQNVRQVSSKKAFAVKKENPFVTVRPVFPGCLCVPAETVLDVTPSVAETKFWLTPTGEGEIGEARVEVWYEGKLLDSIPTPTRVVRQTWAKVAAGFAFIAPAFKSVLGAYDIDVVGDRTGLAGFMVDRLGGAESFGWVCAVVAAVAAVLLFLRFRPKEGAPVTRIFDYDVVHADDAAANLFLEKQQARLLAMIDGGCKTFAIKKERSVIGSGPDADIRIELSGIAAAHAEIVFADGRFRIVPLGGNEVRLGDEPVPAGGAALLAVEALKLGRCQLLFSRRVPRDPAPSTLIALAEYLVRAASRAESEIRNILRAPASVEAAGEELVSGKAVTAELWARAWKKLAQA